MCRVCCTDACRVRRLKNGEGVVPLLTLLNRIVVLSHGMLYVQGAGREALMVLISTLQINGNVPLRHDSLVVSKIRSGMGFIISSIPLLYRVVIRASGRGDRSVV